LERRDPSRDHNLNKDLGARCQRVQAREWASIPSRKHRERHEGLEEPRDGTTKRKLHRSHKLERVCELALPQLFRPTHFPCPANHLNGVVAGAKAFGDFGHAFGVWVSSPDVGEYCVARCGDRVEVFFALKKRKTETALKNASIMATQVRATPCGARGQRSQGNRARVSYLENSLQKSKSYVRFREASESIR